MKLVILTSIIVIFVCFGVYLMSDNDEVGNQINEIDKIVIKKINQQSHFKQKSNLLSGGTEIKRGNHFEEFSELSQKVLKSIDEEKDYQDMLDNTVLIEEAYILLSEPVGDPSDLEEGLKRIRVAEYLEEAMSWRKNPSRGVVITKILGLISNDLINSTSDEKKRKWYAGEKAELYMALKSMAPGEARMLKEGNRDERLNKIIRFAENYQKTLKQYTKKEEYYEKK